MVSETYRRRRRLATLIALLSVAFLIAGAYFGYFLETYSRPRLTVFGEELFLVHTTRAAGDDAEQTALLRLDAGLIPRARLKSLGDCRAAVADGDETILFYSGRFAVLRGGQTVRGADLDQKWEVRAAARDASGDVWIFGCHEGRILFRRRAGRLFSEEQRAADVRGEVDDLAAYPSPGAPIALVWRARGTGLFRAARWTGTRFEPFADVSVPAGEPAAAAVVGRRLLAVVARREDREFLRLNLRLACCDECGLAPPPERVSFRDPVLLLGRKVTGLSLAADRDTVALAATRATTLQVGRFRADDFRPAPAHMVSVAAEPMWRRTAAALWPLMMLFFSFSLVFLGFTLMRERRRFFLEHLAAEANRAPDGRMPAEILQRAMAYILDFMILVPVFFVAVEILSFAPETREIDWSDPLALRMLGLFATIQFAYYFPCELLFGRTIGKRVIGLRVCRRDGSRVGLVGALVRNLLRILDATFVLSIVGVAFMMITPMRRRLGDIAAGTIVVDVSEPQEAKSPLPP
ncbi:MAG: RDD family protein [Planctomycetes bacterium]|nr:RDD family protein [Planctomycetota bacterium]